MLFGVWMNVFSLILVTLFFFFWKDIRLKMFHTEEMRNKATYRDTVTGYAGKKLNKVGNILDKESNTELK